MQLAGYYSSAASLLSVPQARPTQWKTFENDTQLRRRVCSAGDCSDRGWRTGRKYSRRHSGPVSHAAIGRRRCTRSWNHHQLSGFEGFAVLDKSADLANLDGCGIHNRNAAVPLLQLRCRMHNDRTQRILPLCGPRRAPIKRETLIHNYQDQLPSPHSDAYRHHRVSLLRCTLSLRLCHHKA